MEYQSDSVTTCCPANAAHEPSHSSIAEPDAVDSILPPQTNAGSKGKMMEKGRVESSSVSSDGDSGLDMCLSEDDLASSLDRMARNSDTSSATADEELSATGELMQSLWAQLFHVTTNRLDENADFFALGGDVTKALQLTKMACNHGIAISARDIFQHPRLAALSVLARPIHCRPPNAVAPFSLLGSVHSGHLRAQAAQLCHVRLSDVADVLPCTPLQEGLLALTQKNPGHYVAQFRFEMDASISVEKLRRAWDQVVASTPILRTRIVSIPNHGLFQAVLDHGASWASDACPDQDDAGEQHMGLGTPLTRFSIVEGPASRRYFIWHIHHALYDGWSMSLMLKEAEKAYYGEETAGLESMAPFIKYIQDLDESNLRQFWLAQFANMQHSDLLVNALATPLSSQPPRQVTRTKLELHWGRSEFTPSTMIRAAWAVVMARRTNSNEALYGVTMTGRQAEVPRIEYMAGPAIATVPFRVIIDWESSVGQFLYAVQRQGADMIPYEQTGLQRIRRMGGSAAQACAFQSLLVVQPAEKEKAGHSAKFRPFMTIVQSDDTDSTDPDRERDWGTYPIEAECQLGTHDVRLQIDFDCSLVQKSQAEHITQMFNQVLRQLVDHAHGQVSLGTVAEAAQPAVIGLDSIRAWNSKVPDTVEDCVHARFTRMAARQPLAPAVCAWDGDLTYQRLDRLSTIVAGQLVDQGVSGTLVPLLFEKSLWMPVAVLAVMKAGGALVALDMKQPEERLSAIVSQIDSPLLLSSRQNAALAGRLGKKTVVIEGNAEKYPTSSTTQDTNTRLPTVKPSSLLYVVFTSGTTGKPKGVMISHGNFCSAIAYQQRALGYGQECRVFDFASYAFDVAWSNLFFSLTSGACLCIPSALERENDVDGCLKKYHINFMDLTPSLARTIGRDVLSRLSTIILGGEASLPSDVSLAGGNTRIINAYGPSECTPTSHLTYLKDDAISIGHGVGVCTWVIDPDKPDSLVSIGVPGELWIEGPLVGLGYLNDSKKTQSAFVQDPPWLFSVARRNGKLYRTGDLVRYRDDGTIVYMGRKDTQVKIRGQRVELGEVETRLRQLLVASSVAQVIVEATQSAGSKHTALVAFITLSRAQEMTETAHHLAVKEATNKLADRLSKMLPSYMIPAAYFAIREIPMTTTGKADRRQLRNIGASFLLELRNDLEMKDAPAEILNETESLLKTVWMSVLNLSAKQASINTTFSRLGGDSISAMQIVSQCRLHNLGFTVGDIYQNNTIRKLASHCKSACKSINGQVEQVRVDQESKEDAAGLFDLSPIQQAYFDSYPDGLNHYNQSFLLDLGRKVDYDVLLCAIQALVRRHAMLRARFRQEPEGERRSWKQMVVEPGPESFSFVQQSVAHQNEIESIAQGRQERLDICKGPVFACDLFNLPHGGQIILLSAHHLVVDLVSWRIIWNEVEEFLMLGELRSPEPLSFRSWCAKQAKFGRNLSPLSVLPYAIPEPQLDFWGLSPEDNTFGRCEDIDVLLSASTTELLFGSSNNSLRTEAVDLILGALFYSFLHTFPERDLPPIWIEGHGREQFDEHFSADVSGTVGWFTTLYPLTMSMTLNDSISHVVRLVKDTRKKVPGKGQLFFACQHYSESGRQTFQGHSVAEVVFNFTGRFQQLEKHDSILKQSDSIRGTDFKICEISKDARRQAIIELNGGISHGQLGVTCSVPMHARHKLRIRNWIHNFAENLEFIVQTLTDAPTGFTLCDWPLLDLSYGGLDTLLNNQLPSMGISPGGIQDMYPCLPLQEGMLLSSAKGTASYDTVTIGRCIPAGDNGAAVCPARLEAAWKRVVGRHTILSTVFALHPEGNGFIQIVLNGPPVRVLRIETELDCPSEALSRIEQPTFAANEPPHMLVICESKKHEVFFGLYMSHALTDAQSSATLLHELAAEYVGAVLEPAPAFSQVIRFINSTSQAQKLGTWCSLLEGLHPCIFPVASPILGQENQNTSSRVFYASRRKFGILEYCKKAKIAPSSLLQTAWAMVLSHFTGMHDVCFGYMSSGRDAVVNNVDGLVGPLANMLISRVDVRQDARQVLKATSNRSEEHLTIQHASLAQIQHRLGMSGKRLFNTSLSISHQKAKAAGRDSSITIEVQGGDDVHEFDLKCNASFDGAHTDLSLEFKQPLISQQSAKAVYDVFLKAVEYLLAIDVAEMNTVALDDRESFEHVDNENTCMQSLSNSFFKYITGEEVAMASSFWTSQFIGLQASHFPVLLPADHRPEIDSEICLSMSGLDISSGEYAAETLVRATWSLLTARIMGSEESIFGVTIPGNYGPISLPNRSMISAKTPISSFLSELQEQSIAMAQFHHMGIERIRRLSKETDAACNFQTLLTVYEPVTAAEDFKASNGNKAYDDYLQETGKYVMVVCVRPGASTTQLHIQFDSHVVEKYQVERVAEQFENVFCQLLNLGRRQEKLGDIRVASLQDLVDIWSWNSALPEPVEVCIHDWIVQQSKERPKAPAIMAWDGDLTYGQLDHLSSKLANQLASKGVGRGSIVPICFEKSMWMPVAALAVMKAGGASVAIDTSLPEERIRSVTTQVFNNMTRTKIILSSIASGNLAQMLGADVVLTVADDLHKERETATLELPMSQPSDVLYVVFTSGSTGNPKGVVITHRNFSSILVRQRDAFGINSSSRVFDFASYAFDVVWLNLLKTLTVGACLCIPSAAEREDDLGGSLIKYGATVVDMTPSLARIVEPRSALSTLSTLILGGEAVSPSDVHLVGDKTLLMVAYGPAECTPSSTVMDMSRSRDAGIGRGLGACTWVTEAENADMLAPVGAVGELWIEGPGVGIGYLHEPEKTAAVFVQDPVWLMHGSPDGKVPGRNGRVYRTGDLVRYKKDGSLLFVGRKDTQVKIAGQRVELGDIEYHVQRAIKQAWPRGAQVAAEVAQPQGMASKYVVAFISLEGTLSSGEHAEAVRKLTADMRQGLAKALPPYMIPSVYLPLQTIPMSVTRKIDRRRLQEIGSALTSKDLRTLAHASGETQCRAPETDAERTIQTLWAEILGVDPKGISANDSFFKIGGDSIAAMRLVAKARDKGLNLTVRRIFQCPALCDLAVTGASTSN